VGSAAAGGGLQSQPLPNRFDHFGNPACKRHDGLRSFFHKRGARADFPQRDLRLHLLKTSKATIIADHCPPELTLHDKSIVQDQ